MITRRSVIVAMAMSVAATSSVVEQNRRFPVARSRFDREDEGRTVLRRAASIRQAVTRARFAKWWRRAMPAMASLCAD